MTQRVRKGLANWLTSSQTPIFVLDHRRVVLVFNRGCVEFTGRDAAELIGQTCVKQTHPNPSQIESLTGALAPPERVLHGEAATVPAVIPTADKPQTVQISYFPLPLAEGDQDSRIMGVISPLQGSGIELVPESEVRRFELAQVLSELYEAHRLEDLVARSPEMQRVATQIEIARQHSHPIHIIGEPGVGKEYIARLIHYSSSHRELRFLPLDCQQLSHFEIARTLRRLFAEPDEETSVGTVYLAQFNNLAKDLQVELQQQLALHTKFRWISSSQAGLDSLRENEFSHELRARFTASQIEVPALRNRREDTLLIATHFLEKFNRQYKKNVEHFSTEVETEFQAYHWPGNVKELVSVIKDAVQNCQSTAIQMEDLNLQFNAGRDAQRTRPGRNLESLSSFMNRVERERICEVLDWTNHNKKAAAEFLQMTRAKLYRRVEALAIETKEDQADETS